MADQSSGRDGGNSGSDSAGHHGKGTAADQFHSTPGIPKSEVVTNRHPHGAVGNSAGTPGKADDRSAVRS